MNASEVKPFAEETFDQCWSEFLRQHNETEELSEAAKWLARTFFFDGMKHGFEFGVREASNAVIEKFCLK